MFSYDCVDLSFSGLVKYCVYVYLVAYGQAVILFGFYECNRDGRHVEAGFLHFLRQAIASRLFIDWPPVTLHH